MTARPDKLLAAIQKTDGGRRGALRVFLGLGPGVGKTYAMLEAARERVARGGQVLVGIVETHGRRDTEALLEGLTILPRRAVEYRGTHLDEMDLDRLLKERPALALVDELAHTNAPGSRHDKRHQDVEELLAAGIDVFTTINIQHLESRNDEVARITGVRVRETVPDRVLELAAQIEVVDLAPAELLQRLRDGKVYAGERAARAAEGFFKEEHLLALRELALRFVAEKVDQDLHHHLTINGISGPWNTGERLLVAISHAPSTPRLIRRTRRMAYNLDAPWIALHVDTGQVLNAEDQETLRKNSALARELGAELVSVADADVARALRQVSVDRHVTQIIMGRPDRRPWRDFFGGNVLDALVRDVRGIDVHVIRGDRGARVRWPALPHLKSGVMSYVKVASILGLVAAACQALSGVVGYHALGSFFLVAILVISGLTSAGPTLFAALGAAITWDFFFIPPTFTFVITSPADFMMVVTFFVAAVVGGLMTGRLRRQEFELGRRESEARRLYDLVLRLGAARDRGEVAKVLIDTVANHYGTAPSVLLPAAEGRLDGGEAFGAPVVPKEFAVAEWVFANARPAGRHTPTLNGAASLALPLRGDGGVVGVLSLKPPEQPSLGDEAFLNAVLTQASLVLERLRLRETAEAGRLLEASENLHQTLLNSVSHELRTPITALMGSAAAIKDAGDPELRAGFADEMIRAAKRLDRVVENLLDVSRLEKGALRLRREWFEVGELIDEVRRVVGEDLADRRFTVAGDVSTLVCGDFQLLVHALQQIVFNATRYTPAGGAVEVAVRAEDQWLTVRVRDEGPGLPAGDADRVFEKFYRAPGAPAGGLGLGLSILKSIVELHGGVVGAGARGDRSGAEFAIELPLETPPSVLKEAMGE